MTDQVFIRQLSHLPEGMKTELWAYFEYLLLKYQIPKSALENKPDNGPAKKAPKAGFLKGTFVMDASFDEPLEDFKEYMS